MKQLHFKKKDLDLKEYTKRTALETDFETLIKEDALICVDGKPVILYQRLPWDFSQLVHTLNSIQYATSTRSNGLKTTSRVFGYQPRIAVRRDFCTATSLANENPRANKLISKFGKEIAPIYQNGFPQIFEQHRDWTKEKVLEEWKIEETPFTSGIINKNNPLKYHFDAGNIKEVCSCMIGLKRNIGGGYLSIPELRIGLEICDQSLTIFDGQKLLHGVTPINQLSGNSYRYTIVYYTLHQMWKCETVTKELARIRSVKSQRELKRTTLNQEAELKVTQHGIEEGVIE